MEIVPAILAKTYDDFTLRLRQAEYFSDYVQIDIMDGSFVPDRSFPEEKINVTQTSISFEIHLMVKNPSSYMSRISSPKLKKVIFHVESEVEHLDFIKQLTGKGIFPGLAVNPETELTQFYELAQHVHTLMFMTVNPGKYGSPFRRDVVNKVAEARKFFSNKIISVDGGISLDNLKLFYDIGVDYVCVGSRIFLNEDPAKSYGTFIHKIAELEIKQDS
jgi:ribulose-phosphate 3-epimerase